ncbi:hypothetical protein PENTCL1PPCAC_21922, partial [Pristionchus entomophagus]
QVLSEGFVRPSCGTEKNLPSRKEENKFLAKNLPHCKLSTHMEERVNAFIDGKFDGKPHDKKVIVRVLPSVRRKAQVKKMMKSEFGTNAKYAFPVYDKFPYTSKAIFAFQVIDGVGVCFSGMHVQEYGSDCAEPNARRVYIAYFDSVLYFEPRELRTDVYYELLLGYLE